MSKTTWTGILSALVAALTTLAALPYTLGDVATWISPEWKPWVFKIGFIATVALRILKSVWTADASAVTGAPPGPSTGQMLDDLQSKTKKAGFVLLLLGITIGLTGLTGCADYEGHVAARQDSLSGYAKDGGYGGALTHRVEFDR